MAYNYEYPYTDAQRYNDDWLINKVKELATDWIKTSGEWTETKQAWEELKHYITDYFNNLDVQEEINEKLEAMKADGSLFNIIKPLFDEYQQGIDVLSARMDTFTALGDGATTGDAELADIRVDYTGHTWPNAGDAFRGVTGQLSSEIEAKTSFAEVVMDIANPNNIVENRYWISAESLAVMDGWHSIEIEVEPNTDYSFWNYNDAFTWLLDENKQSLGKMHDIIGGGSDITTPNNCHYIRASAPTRRFVLINRKGYFDHQSRGYMVPITTKIPTLENNEINANNVSVSNHLLRDIYSYIDESNVTTFNDGVITQTHNGGGNNWWLFRIQPNEIITNFLLLEWEVSSINGGVMIYLHDGTRYIAVKEFNNIGSYKHEIDLNHLAVYSNLDLNQPLSILFTNATEELLVTYTKANVYNLTSKLDTDKNLLENLNDMSNDITSLKGNIQTVANNIKLVGSDGQKYVLQVSNGNLVSVPVLPENILYIGNSLLLGFGTFGMAASNSNEDYFAYVNDYVRSQGIDLVSNKISGTAFEGCTTAEEQNQWFNNTLINSLNNDLDMVIIQLGDNVNTTERMAVFESGAKNLIAFIRSHTPNARVVWVGEWYSNTQKQLYIANACASYGAIFVDISNLPSISGNQANIGDVITRDDGSTFTIDNSGVASHPSSKGMKAIADRIIETLF